MIVKFNSNFYNRDVLEEAISSFSELLDAQIISEVFEVDLVLKGNSKQILDEFANYALSLMRDRL